MERVSHDILKYFNWCKLMWVDTKTRQNKITVRYLVLSGTLVLFKIITIVCNQLYFTQIEVHIFSIFFFGGLI